MLILIVAVEQRDPACKSIAQVFLYFKGKLSYDRFIALSPLKDHTGGDNVIM